MSTVRERKPKPMRQHPSKAQLAWIEARDRVGEIIDDYLRTMPSIEMRAAVEQLEVSLALGDHTAGLL